MKQVHFLFELEEILDIISDKQFELALQVWLTGPRVHTQAPTRIPQNTCDLACVVCCLGPPPCFVQFVPCRTNEVKPSRYPCVLCDVPAWQAVFKCIVKCISSQHFQVRGACAFSLAVALIFAGPSSPLLTRRYARGTS